MTPPRVFIVSHTHWDREWYLPFHRFRVLLDGVVRQVLDRLENDPAFEHFLLDGQAVALEDHLEIHPEDAPRVKALVTSGALSIGPWYVLSDEFLVSGEATVRNLLLGHRVCARYGGAQEVGYLPDSFGHIAQMPQILRRAGIDSFVFTRGRGDEADDLDHEFLWRAPDGSEVLAIHQCGGYCGGGALGHERYEDARTSREVVPALAVEQVRALLEKHARGSSGDVVLISNGCDHLPPQRDLGRILAALREAFPDTTFTHGSLARYLEAVREAGFVAKRFQGELLGAREELILSGVWSSRLPLKQENDRAQTLQAGVLEPTAAYAHFRWGIDYPRALIESAWKLLLRCHPHDSICGCSSDEVHREMTSRSAGVIQTAEQILAGHLDRLAPSAGPREEDEGPPVIAVMNPLPVPRREVVERMLLMPADLAGERRLGLFDDEGRPVPFEVVGRRFVPHSWGIDYGACLSGEEQRERFENFAARYGARFDAEEDPGGDRDAFLMIRFVADLPALGHARYVLRERAEDEPAPGIGGGVTGSADAIENDLVRVRLRPDGLFDLTDKTAGRAFPGLGRLSDTEDVGDEYDCSAAPESRTVSSEGAPGRVVPVPGEPDGATAARRACFTMRLPRAVEPDRRRRSAETVDCPVETTVRLRPGSPVVDVEIRFENRAEDHRLGVDFPTPLAGDQIVSDGQFLVHRRPIDPPRGERWLQAPPGTVPQQDFSAIEDGAGGLAVLNRGLPEARPFREEGGTGLSVTLLRCVGWLSRDDLASRPGRNAGPTLPTPGAQCPGHHRFRLAVMPYSGGWLEAGVKGHAERWRVPPISTQGVRRPSLPGGRGLLESRSPRTSVTAIKRAEERDTLVVRVVNLAGEPTGERLVFGLPVRGAWRTDLLEHRESALPVEGGHEVTLPLGPFEIATVEVELGPVVDPA